MRIEFEVKFNSTELHQISWISEVILEEKEKDASVKKLLRLGLELNQPVGD